MSAERSSPSGSIWISMARSSGVSGSWLSASTASASAVPGSGSFSTRVEARSIRPPAMMKGSLGRLGIRHSDSAANPATRSGSCCRVSWRTMSEPMSSPPVARVTIRPVATERRSAGTWETRPSPMESRL